MSLSLFVSVGCKCCEDCLGAPKLIPSDYAPLQFLRTGTIVVRSSAVDNLYQGVAFVPEWLPGSEPRGTEVEVSPEEDRIKSPELVPRVLCLLCDLPIREADWYRFACNTCCKQSLRLTVRNVPHGDEGSPAGRALFALQRFHSGSTLGMYSGVPTALYQEDPFLRHGDQYIGVLTTDYVQKAGISCIRSELFVVGGTPYASPMQFANTCGRMQRKPEPEPDEKELDDSDHRCICNAEFDHSIPGALHVRATRDIMPGEEILLHYGNDYLQDMIKHGERLEKMVVRHLPNREWSPLGQQPAAVSNAELLERWKRLPCTDVKMARVCAALYRAQPYLYPDPRSWDKISYTDFSMLTPLSDMRERQAFVKKSKPHKPDSTDATSSPFMLRRLFGSAAVNTHEAARPVLNANANTTVFRVNERNNRVEIEATNPEIFKEGCLLTYLEVVVHHVQLEKAVDEEKKKSKKKKEENNPCQHIVNALMSITNGKLPIEMFNYANWIWDEFYGLLIEIITPESFYWSHCARLSAHNTYITQKKVPAQRICALAKHYMERQLNNAARKFPLGNFIRWKLKENAGVEEEEEEANCFIENNIDHMDKEGKGNGVIAFPVVYKSNGSSRLVLDLDREAILAGVLTALNMLDFSLKGEELPAPHFHYQP